MTPPCSTAALWQNQRVGRYGVAGGVDATGWLRRGPERAAARTRLARIGPDGQTVKRWPHIPGRPNVPLVPSQAARRTAAGSLRPSANPRMGPICKAPSDPQAQLSMEARSGWFPNGVKDSEHPPAQRPRPPHPPAQPHSASAAAATAAANAARSACSCVRLTGRLAAAEAAVADGRTKARRLRRPSTCAHPCNACKSMY